MTTKHLKQWSTFYNSNGYLCLIHKVEGGSGQIVNYNGTFYSVKLDNEDRPNYSKSTMTPDEFFIAFNETVFSHKDDTEGYRKIKARFYVKKKVPKLLLLCLMRQ